MKSMVIGCQTLKNELLAAMEKTGCSFEIVWIEAHLHNLKDKLKNALQEILDQADSSYDRILFATGFCGNSVSGLQSRQATLVIPKVDDCISLLFNGCKNKTPWKDSYFLTEGWIQGQNSIWNEYLYALNKYGPKRAERIFHVLFAHYSRIALLDTGCYNLEPSLKEAEKIADTFSLDCSVIPVNTAYIENLLTGPWDEERFLIVPPETVITPASLSHIY